ncbi:DUF6527 family protein [Sphingomonas sp. MMS24-J13]|uniref:DUF6527 family protein n=1 Tax=Sphingomonas sp. MMS24-J13 TaxID=3238686 RepID=UPI00384F7E45
MKLLSPILKEVTDSAGGLYLWIYCPGCESEHSLRIRTPHGDNWSWNGNADRPTFRPSLLVRTCRAVDPSFVPEPGDPPEVCHSYIIDGRIQFLADSTHALAGQTIDLSAFEL